MSDVGEIIGRLKLDASQWFAEIERAKESADSLRGIDPTIRVHADTGAALAEIEAVKAAADNVGGGGNSRGTGAASAAAATQDLLAAATTRADIAFAAASARLDRYVDDLDRAAASAAAAAAGQDEFDRHLLEGVVAADAEAAAIERDTRSKVADTAAADTAGNAYKKQSNAMGGLVGALIAVSAAAPPVAAGALGIAGALSVAGGVGVLAILGIKKAYTEASAEGDQARATVGGFLDVVNQLERTATGGVLNGLTSGLRTVQASMPELNRDVGMFSDSLGRIISSAAPGMLGFLHQLMPLFGNAELYLERIVAGLAGFAASNGFTQFVGYAIANLPNVEAFLGQVVQLVFRLLAAWAPLGQVALPILTEMVRLIASIPLPILTAMIGAVAAGAAAFSLYQAVPAKLMAVVAAEGLLGAASTGMAAAIDVATGPIGWIVGALSLLGAGFMAATQHERDLATATATYTQILEAQNSVTSETLRAQVAQQAVQQGLITQGLAIGVSAQTTVDAMLGQRDATKQVAQAIQQHIAAAGQDAAAQDRAAGQTLKYQNAVINSNVASRQAVTAAKQYAAAMGSATSASRPLTAAQQQQAAAAQAVAEGFRADMAAAKSLGDTYDQVTIDTDSLIKALKNSKGNLDENTVAGAQNAMQFRHALTDIKAHADALNSDGKHAAEARAYTLAHARSLEEQAIKAGADKGAVDRLVASLLGVSRTHPVSKIDVQTAAAMAQLESLQSKLGNLNGYTAWVYVNLAGTAAGASGRAGQIARNAMYGMADGGSIGHAADGITAGFSGTVSGPGNAWNDMAGLWALANGEEVISNKRGQADAFRPLLKAINSQKVKTPQQLGYALAGGHQQPTTVITRTIEPHITIQYPVTQDPETAAREAAQYIQAYSGI